MATWACKSKPRWFIPPNTRTQVASAVEPSAVDCSSAHTVSLSLYPNTQSPLCIIVPCVAHGGGLADGARPIRRLDAMAPTRRVDQTT